MNITTTVEGLERYPVNLRYSRDLRDNPAALRDILVQTPTRQQIPLGHLATMSFLKGPPAIKSEQARPNAWVYVDIEDVDVGTYVERAREAVAAQVEIPTGYSLGWSGQYEYMMRAQERMQLVRADHPAADLHHDLRKHAIGRPDPHRALGGPAVADRHLLAAVRARTTT